MLLSDGRPHGGRKTIWTIRTYVLISYDAGIQRSKGSLELELDIEDAMSIKDEAAPITRLTFLLEHRIVLDVQLVTEDLHALVQQFL
jgi:hypothetical protein